MITPEQVNQPIQLRARVSSPDLATLISAVASANVIELPAGKTLADVTNLNLSVLANPLPDGTLALLTGALK